MEPFISVEWLQSFDSDYEPSGLMTPNDRKELERRKAERLANEAADAKNSAQTLTTEPATLAAQ